MMIPNLDDDDLPIGRVLSRRDAVRLLAVGGAAALAGCRPAPRDAAASAGTGAALGGSAAGEVAAGEVVGAGATLPACVAKPELTVGPYFVDVHLNRADVRVEPATGAAKPGAPLRLTFNVQQIANGRCAPLPGAMVDIWQCDADGQYSAVNDRMVGFDTQEQKFLRGYQVTDAGGRAAFTTIYPGWYRGRAVHIHFKIRTPASAVAANQASDDVYEFTSQLFFDEALTDRVHAQAPYAAKGRRDVRNLSDGIFRQSRGTLMLAVAQAGDGYDGTFDIGLDLSDAAVGRAERSGRGRRPPA